jgi:hypothetical protein
MQIIPKGVYERPGMPTSSTTVPSRGNFTGSQLRRTCEEFEYRIDVYRRTNGTHIERLQINLLSLCAVFKLSGVCIHNHFESIPVSHKEHAVAYSVEALCYKPEGRGFDSG